MPTVGAMNRDEKDSAPVRVVTGYDGSPEANAAIEVGALLFPAAHGWIAYLWVPPFASDKVRRRLRARARDLDELIAMIEQEGECEAQRLVATGVTLATNAGWHAESLLKRTWGGEGWRIAQVAADVEADVVLVGSRGLGGTRALLGERIRPGRALLSDADGGRASSDVGRRLGGARGWTRCHRLGRLYRR